MTLLPRSVLDATLAVAELPRPVLVACDVDGTLAPIVDRPERARMAAGAAMALHELAECGAHVVIISGRTLADLRSVYGELSGLRLFGSHGAEDSANPSPEVPGAAERLGRVRLLAERAAATAPGAWVEEKYLAVALHTRLASPATGNAARAWLAAELDGVGGVWLRAGHEVLEAMVHPSSKVATLSALVSELAVEGVFYAGDDPQDELVFDLLHDVPSRLPSVRDAVTVKVGNDPSCARYRVASPEQLVSLLLVLAGLTPSAK